MFVLRSLLFPHRGGRAETLNSACKTDQADFTDWKIFLPSNFIKEIHPTEALSKNTWSLLAAWGNWKENDLSINGLILLITYRTFVCNKYT